MASGIVGRIAAMEAQLLMARGASRAKLPADSDAAAAGHVEQALADFDASLGTHHPLHVCCTRYWSIASFANFLCD